MKESEAAVLELITDVVKERIESQSNALKRIRIAFNLSDKPMAPEEIALHCEFLAKEFAKKSTISLDKV